MTISQLQAIEGCLCREPKIIISPGNLAQTFCTPNEKLNSSGFINEFRDKGRLALKYFFLSDVHRRRFKTEKKKITFN